MLARTPRDWITPTQLLGMQNETATLENHLAISKKTKYTTAVHPSNDTPGHLSKRKETSCSHKKLVTEVCSSFMCNSQTTPTPLMPFGGWQIRYRHAREYPHQRKGTSYRCLQRPGWIFRASCRVKKANHQRFHTVWFPLYNIPEIWQWKTDQWLPEVRQECHRRKVSVSKTTGGILMVMEMFCVLTVSTSTSWFWRWTIVSQGAIILKHLLSTYYVPCTVLSTLILKITLSRRYN